MSTLTTYSWGSPSASKAARHTFACRSPRPWRDVTASVSGERIRELVSRERRFTSLPAARPGVDFLTTLGPHAGRLDLAAGHGDRQPHVIDGDHFSGPTGRGARELLGVEELHGRSLMRGPRTRLWIRTADEVPDGLDGLLPVDLDVFLLAPPFVRRLGFVLNDSRRRAGAHQIHGLEQRRDPERIEPLEVEAAQGVAVPDLDVLLQQDRPRIQTLVGPEDAQPGPRLAHHDRPVDGAGAAVAREQRGMVLDGAARGLIQHLLGHDECDVGHHAEIRLESREFLPHLWLVAKGSRLIDREATGERGLLQGIDSPSSLGRLRGTIDADDVFPALQ